VHKRILVAYDGSPLSYKSIETAKYQAAQDSDSEVHIISVIEATGPYTNVNISRSISKEISEKCRPQMEKIEEEFRKENISVVTDILLAEQNENPGSYICNYADNNDIDLIIMGSRGLGNIKKLFLGSVSNYVVQNAKCPVLIIK